MDTVGRRIRAWRRRRGGMSQQVLAGLAGLSEGYVSQIESGQRPLDRKSTQVAIAQALDVTADAAPICCSTRIDTTKAGLISRRSVCPTQVDKPDRKRQTESGLRSAF